MTMGLPVYSSRDHQLVFFGSDYNKGLRFERFFDKYSLGKSQDEFAPGDDAKKKFLGNYKGSCGDHEQLTTHAMRQMTLAKSQNGNGRVYSLEGHFVTGMGNSHPVENGFLWHYTLGVPYIPGSQVKGLIRGLFEQYFDGTDEEKKKVLHEWFGSRDKDPKKCGCDDNGNSSAHPQGKDTDSQKYASKAGSIVFFDAIPVAPPTLGVDIMTPHMGDWYAEGGKIQNVRTDADKLPADWHDPVPIPFLSVHTAQFLFTIAPRPGSNVNEDKVFQCLDNALKYLGAGAKTQTGYGYMTIDNHAQKIFFNKIAEKQEQLQQKMEQLQQEKAFQKFLEGKSELAKKFLKEQKEHNWEVKEKGIFINPAQGEDQSPAQRWLEQLENNPEPDVFVLFKDLMESLFPDIYANPHKTKGKKKKPVFKERAIAIIDHLKQLEQKNTGKE